MATTRRRSKTAIKAESILRHGFVLQRIFPATKEFTGPVMLYNTLRRLEKEAHRLAEAECNRPLPEGYAERKEKSILRRLDTLLKFKAAGVPVFFNGDPRGYALKIHDSYARTVEGLKRDVGGYGILAPDFD